jgi:hypothetical protein
VEAIERLHLRLTELQSGPEYDAVEAEIQVLMAASPAWPTSDALARLQDIYFPKQGVNP